MKLDGAAAPGCRAAHCAHWFRLVAEQVVSALLAYVESLHMPATRHQSGAQEDQALPATHAVRRVCVGEFAFLAVDRHPQEHLLARAAGRRCFIRPHVLLADREAAWNVMAFGRSYWDV